MDAYLTPEEVAERLRINPALVRIWLRKRELKGIKIGRLWRIAEKEVDVYLRGLEIREPVAVH